MKAHRWAGSGTGLGRRFECGGCGTEIFSYAEPVPAGDGTLHRRPYATNRWESSGVSADCDAEKVREVMES